jgi:hypothetical protein
MNGLRIWLAWEVFGHGSDAERAAFLDHVDQVFSICAALGQPVMPVLFNRWHGQPDFGGIYLDHFLPDGGWAGQHFEHHWREYITAMMRRFATDPRIFAWDLCNEPYSYSFRQAPDPKWELEKYETAWLTAVYEACKEGGAQAPLSVGFAGPTEMVQYPQFSDILNFHYYWLGKDSDLPKWHRGLDKAEAMRDRTGKPLISTECCWGSLDAADRVRILEIHLAELNRRGIGWMIHALSHSRIADLHRPEYGFVGAPGSMHCVEPDGTLRPHHDAINRHL